MDGIGSTLLLFVIVAGVVMYFANRRELETLRNAIKQHALELAALRRQIAALTRPDPPPTATVVPQPETRAALVRSPVIAPCCCCRISASCSTMPQDMQ
jgi:hypothetical protein